MKTIRNLERVAFLDIADSDRKYDMNKQWEIHSLNVQKMALVFNDNMYDFFSWQQKTKEGLPAEIDYIDMSYEWRDIILPSDLNSRLVHYLQKPDLWVQWDRNKFVEEITGELFHVFSMQDYNPEREYKVWSPAYVLDKWDNITHSHIYLWENLFLGKGTSHWSLVVSRPEEQEKLWNGIKTQILSPSHSFSIFLERFFGYRKTRKDS